MDALIAEVQTLILHDTRAEAHNYVQSVLGYNSENADYFIDLCVDILHWREVATVNIFGTLIFNDGSRYQL